jgi:2-oxoglutarate ferredoxin oxidoreductase subunit alpha
VNSGTFGKENLRKAGYKSNPLDDPKLAEKYNLVAVDITRMTLDILEESPLKKSAKQLCKNFFALGLMYWMYDRSMDLTISWLEKKFANKEDVCDANIKVLKAGYYYGETAEVIGVQYKVSRARMEPIASIDILHKIALLRFGRQTCTWTSTLHINNHKRQFCNQC